MEDLKYLYGASGHCKVIIDVLKTNNLYVTAIFDDQPKWETINNVPIFKPVKLATLQSGKMLISIGSNHVRKLLASKIDCTFFTAIHSSAIISESVKIGEGTAVMASAIINADSNIGKHCIINTGVIVEHDCIISDFVHISPNASLAGNITIGEGTHVGIGACMIQGIKIGKWATIGAGAVIIKDVPDFAVVVGNPGKIIKYNKLNE
ncbi:acetyltransferase [Flavobacterium sp. LAR06]|uniref:acetyltransferase n=1 Tax=Flavobacterium sp. LAR06 TaxID=3064897 RepID=UPI0035C17DB0